MGKYGLRLRLSIKFRLINFLSISIWRPRWNTPVIRNGFMCKNTNQIQAIFSPAVLGKSNAQHASRKSACCRYSDKCATRPSARSGLSLPSCRSVMPGSISRDWRSIPNGVRRRTQAPIYIRFVTKTSKGHLDEHKNHNGRGDHPHDRDGVFVRRCPRAGYIRDKCRCFGE